MPNCRDCQHLDAANQRCKFNVESQVGHFMERPLERNCVHALVKNHCENAAGYVLEIGAGTWRGPRKLLNLSPHKPVWTGVDPRYEDNVQLRGFRGTASRIPFTDSVFDMALALETIEHWYEYGEHPIAGLHEICRVLKPGGKLVVSCPIHVHGQREFVIGDTATILSWWQKSGLWSKVKTEDWRRDPTPLAVDHIWRRGPAKRVRTLEAMGSPSAWVMEVVSWKK